MSSSSSTPSLAVIIVCALIGAAVFLFLLVRIAFCIHRRRVNKPLPLPPARPLTFHQEAPWGGTAHAHARTHMDMDNASAPSLGVYTNRSSDPLMSQMSLLPARGMGMGMGMSASMSRQLSVSTEETPLHQPPSPSTPFSASSAGSPLQLAPPQPSFFAASDTSSVRSSARLSTLSSAEDSDPGGYPPLRHQSASALPLVPLPEDYSSAPQLSGSPSAYASGSGSGSAPGPGSGSGSGSPRRTSSPATTRPRARPVSVAASLSSSGHTARSMRSTRSLSTIRGAPHSPHSRVEIVLPPPLARSFLSEGAPGGGARAGTGAREEERRGQRQSTCDPWIRVGRGSAEQAQAARPHLGGERRSQTVDSEGRLALGSRSSKLSLSSSSSNGTSSGVSSTAYTTPRTSSAHSRTHSPHRKTSAELDLDRKRLPPVPRVPSMYHTSTSSSSFALPHPPLSSLDPGDDASSGTLNAAAAAITKLGHW